ncbi:MAG: right-handed parallel beta-helix repeat-containing protein, partial [Phycisphaerales bacterium]|nr:right-handed parallel beta-helix repeat-containing protein [Phycisphaerales bacterium]
TTGTDRTISFDLVARARVFGGFDGTEVALAQRDPVAHPTILSGEIGLAGAIDNSQHVVRADESFIDRDSILDGFIITAGNMSSVAGTGGGVFITNGAKPTIANCRIVGNNAFAAGGGVRVEGNASPLIMNCAILGNTARNAAGLDVVNAAATVINPLIAHNASSLVSPGGVRWTNATGTLANGVIVGNTSNGLVGQAAQITVASSTLNITHNDIEDLDGSIGDATNFDEDPAFLNLPGTDGVVGTVDDDLRLTDCSPLIEKGSIVALPLDLADLDEDFDTTERYSIDITNGARIINDPSHAGVSVDVGPLEHPGSPLPDPDLNDDGIVGPPDLAILLSAWDTDGCHPADLNGDGTVGPADLALLLAAWTVNP